MEDFKRYLSENADEEERAAADLVKDGLEALRRKAGVEAVDELRRAWFKKQRRRRLLMLLALLVLSGGACWLWWRQRAGIGGRQKTPVGLQLQDSLQNANYVAKEIPQADSPGISPEFAEAAENMIRETLKNPLKLADINQQSTWNQITHNLSAGKPEAVLRDLPALEVLHKQEADWIRAIIYLQKGQREQALDLLRKVSANSNSLRKSAARHTLEMLEPGQKPLQMAQNHTIKPDNSRFPAPNIRGSSVPDPHWQELLNRIWHTSYPPPAFPIDAALAKIDSLLRARNFGAAYVQIQKMERADPSNDQIRYLKGYCLLELGEGNEALRYFEGLETGHEAWKAQLEWYRGLASLLAGDREKAILQFNLINRSRQHPYRRDAMNALKVIR